ncbi:hypothetical protein [Nonlabens xiamenensis]|uniref:hypothetical protein n=1 Tax=Nonlabens xiamenensis TaxID=2341043 RepID=UPI000F60F742|nr:hypothetical protein [Nonlabens xiamenensis]
MFSNNNPIAIIDVGGEFPHPFWMIPYIRKHVTSREAAIRRADSKGLEGKVREKFMWKVGCNDGALSVYDPDELQKS